MVKRTSRLNSRELKIIKSFLIEKYGNICQIDKKQYSLNKLVVDHIDNNPLNNEDSNLQLICQSCNITKDPPYNNISRDVDNFSLGAVPSLRKYEGEYMGVYAAVGSHSYSVLKNLKSEPLFRSWLEKEMTLKLVMQVDQVINDGANIAECSTKTATTYLNKLIYETGPYYIFEDPETGLRYLKWKEEYFPYKTIKNKKIKKNKKEIDEN